MGGIIGWLRGRLGATQSVRVSGAGALDPAKRSESPSADDGPTPRSKPANETLPADTGVSKWLVTLGSAVATLLSALSGLVTAVLAGASGSQQFFVNEPGWVLATAGLFLAGTFVSVYGLFIRHPRDTDEDKVQRTRWLGYGIALLLTATIAGVWTLIQGYSIEQQPEVSVSFDAKTKTIKATVTSSGLVANRRVTAAVLAYYNEEDCVYLYRSDLGPKPDGSVSQEISVGVPERTFARVVVIGWTRTLAATDPASAADPAEPLTHLIRPCRSAGGAFDLDPVPDCRTPFRRQENFSCAEFRLEGVFNSVAQLSATTSETGDERRVAIQATAYLLPWDSLLLTVTRADEILYQGRLIPEPNGVIDDSVSIAIGAVEQRLCVTAVLYRPLGAQRPLPAPPCPPTPGQGTRELGWLLVHQPPSAAKESPAPTESAAPTALASPAAAP